MMISPEEYYDEHLKGKDEKQIMIAICGLKQEIGRLKIKMESPDYGGERKIMPSESTRLWCTRMYLDRAKQALAEVGGTYSPSNTEQKAESFNASIPSISKIILSIGDFLSGYEKRTVTVAEEHLKLDVEHSLIPKPSNLPMYSHKKEEFFDGLREVYIGEWKTNYLNYNLLDGTQWELTIEFSDGQKPFKAGGNNAYPYNFNALQELLGVDIDEDYDE